ncbi:probable G-protein coupled receptor Mth-like 6 [Photinus pyralis]|uniref:probable G-protein coupled receptor Mth-like 6 n=1 Tax=Photinus pyralis TaxID=7054 RepID=UPI0012671CE4|nr:probable G-protein coupled receptor Mth-like 6 [Photinus pyralis]
MNLLAALFMNQLLYVIGVGGVPDSELCIAISFSMQYVRLCTFCWILAMTHHMNAQFKSNLNLVPCDDHAIGKHFVRYSLFAWGIPAILLGASVFIQYRDKAGKLLDTASLKTHNCWFLDTNALVYGLLIPSTVLVIITLTYVIRGAIVARYVISMQVDRKVRNKMRKKRTLQVVLFTKVSIGYKCGAIEDVYAFFYAVNIYKVCENESDAHVLKGIAMLLHGTTGTWWQGIKDTVST